MASTINTIHIGGVDKEIEDSVARAQATSAEGAISGVVAGLNTLEARVDQIAHLPSGSTTGDAELIDIRTGYNGTVYPNAGTSVRTQTEELARVLSESILNSPNLLHGDVFYTNCLNGAVEDFNDHSISIPSGATGHNTVIAWRYYINAFMSNKLYKNKNALFYVEFTNSNYTVKPNEILVYYTSGGQFTSLEILGVFTGVNGHRFAIGTFGSTSTSTGDIAVAIQIRNTTAMSNAAKIKLYGTGIMADYNANRDNPYNEKIRFKDVPLYTGCFIAAQDGRLVGNANYSVTDYIDVRSVDEVWVSDGAIQFAFFSKDGNFLSGVAVQKEYHPLTAYDVPSDAAYVRLSVYNNFIDEAYFALYKDGGPCPVKRVIVSKSFYPKTHGVTDFNTLRAAFEYAMKFDDVEINVVDGTYNLLEEFSSEIENSQTTEYGLPVGRGVHAVFASKTKITALYTGNKGAVTQNFAPFRMAKDSNGNYYGGGFTIENADVSASGTRYIVHHEYGGQDIGKSLDRIINCHFERNNYTDTPIRYYPQCIGGGFAKDTYVEIVGCYFNCIMEQSEQTFVSYHNCSAGDARSVVNVRDCYFEGGGLFRITHYGSSTLISKAVLSNNSFGAPPICRYETEDHSTPENTEIFAYMNEVRN